VFLLPLDTDLELSNEQIQELEAIRIISLPSFDLGIWELSFEVLAQLIDW
jgi:hypothetical protein